MILWNENVTAVKDVCVVIVILCDLETYLHSKRFLGFRVSTSFCAGKGVK